MDEIVLLFNLENKEYGKAMKHILDQLSVNAIFIDSTKHHERLGYLLKEDGYEKTTGEESFEEEMIVFHKFYGDQTKMILDIFESAKLPYIPLKAMTTPNNIEWSAIALKDEVKKEYEALNVSKQTS